MKLQEIFDALTYGELSNLALGGLAEGGIQPDRYKQVVSHINLGMTYLHKRFSLKEEYLILALQPGKTEYLLNNNNAVTGFSSVPVRTIIDSRDKPFQNNIIKIIKVETDAGYELGLNDGADRYSVFTPKHNALNVPIEIVSPPTQDLPKELITSTLKITFQANAIPINEDTGMMEPEDTEVDLPYAFLPALLYFVGNRANSPTGSGQIEGNMGGIYYKKFLEECNRLKSDGIDIDGASQSSRLQSNGWV